MPIEFICGDITRLKVDAIVNAANNSLLGGGGVDGAIHRAAGPALLEECRALGGCPTGQAKITKGYRLDAKYVIHTVGPVWQGGGMGEEALLAGCYRNSLALAKEYGCETVAFPLISAGVYGYPKGQALQVAIDAIAASLEEGDMRVTIVVFDKTGFGKADRMFPEVGDYVDGHYEERSHPLTLEAMLPGIPAAKNIAVAPDRKRFRLRMPRRDERVEDKADAAPDIVGADELLEALETLDESFSQAVLRIIDEKGITDVVCYKRANMSRKLFSKIRSDVHYKPGKRTAVALAIGLRLTLPETEALLKKAGIALSRSEKFDVIIEYFIVNGIYDIHEINKTLFFFDQPLLGA